MILKKKKATTTLRLWMSRASFLAQDYFLPSKNVIICMFVCVYMCILACACTFTVMCGCRCVHVTEHVKARRQLPSLLSLKLNDIPRPPHR